MEVLWHRPGFVAADLLVDAHGTTIVHHARRRDAESVHAMKDDPLVRARMAPAWAIARPVVRWFTPAYASATGG